MERRYKSVDRPSKSSRVATAKQLLCTFWDANKAEIRSAILIRSRSQRDDAPFPRTS